MNRVARCGLLLALLLSTSAHAEPENATAQREIAALLHALGTSQCAFFRNGTWHDSAEAERHLKRKLDYFEHRRLLSTADAFIDDAASRSSMSGKAYQVRCAGKPVQASADWLRQKLSELRQREADASP
ncbi:MAG TPA: DUF5329 domain-containing protein [Dokdonella sp.]|uniref:DUF5329 family protein n=1 Tax=Dokdonella sp. TaxID=2291710 RepID=UPI002B7352B4|nr:DUF5329 domain-containing protein [Xanthomonadales bacterium]MBL0223813.1 DUF5329 domain-containing protein [Xanthomonadales bacterium]HQV72183.1 DUF5329 domain-containing protein [Dokdonella sp.]HQW75826.1 DUF5329 domain-containing protein [Dokdonella sp.]HQZ62354.1 DUF5329 domain-containing protein [Dokdonella sp.]